MENLAPYNLTTDPVASFAQWFESAKKHDDNPEAFTLATSSLNGIPSARVLLLKGFGPRAQFRFFTHSSSQKGQDLRENPRACMVFYWQKSETQIRIAGDVKEMSREKTLEYFSTRAYKSQLASFVSDQSQEIESRQVLEDKFQQALRSYKEGEVPLPEHWQGYELEATSMEFFVYGEHRLNDRFLYELDSKKAWSVKRLQP